MKEAFLNQKNGGQLTPKKYAKPGGGSEEGLAEDHTFS